MKITIHQPEHAPWLGFFDKISACDCAVLLDTVQFRKNYYQNRNKIRTHTGWQWVTVPVRHAGLSTPIQDVEIDTSCGWQKKYWSSVTQAYSKAAFFKEYAADIEGILKHEYRLLEDLNCAIISYFAGRLAIRTKFIRAQELGAEGKAGDLVLSICRALQATTYLSGISGKEYLDVSAFKAQGIAVEFQEFHHPVYTQQFEPFIPYMSCLDLLFTYGPKAKDILLGPHVPRLSEVLE